MVFYTLSKSERNMKIKPPPPSFLFRCQSLFTGACCHVRLPACQEARLWASFKPSSRRSQALTARTRGQPFSKRIFFQPSIPRTLWFQASPSLWRCSVSCQVIFYWILNIWSIISYIKISNISITASLHTYQRWSIMFQMMYG